jgi:ABC-type multidrug transport system permease subunit
MRGITQRKYYFTKIAFSGWALMVLAFYLGWMPYTLPIWAFETAFWVFVLNLLLSFLGLILGWNK